ncbi:MAG: electron transport complex subunit RsxD [Pseudomonadales bacterium]
MAFLRVTSPHAHSPTDTASVMRLVLYASIPGVLCLSYFFGAGIFVNIIWACLVALGCEALVLRLRGRQIGLYLKDYSAIVTAVLLAIAIPPYAPWWVLTIGVAFAIIIGKNLYGGLGSNPFNPAMVGYVVLLISFPIQMTSWGAPINTIADQAAVPGVLDALRLNFGLMKEGVDAFTMATPLDILKQNKALEVSELWQQKPQFGLFAGRGWEYANLWFAVGGCYLLYRRIFTWHAPISMLLALGFWAALFYDGGSSASGGSPMFHWFSGATMLGAFFIVTDPVTSAVSTRGRMVYGALIGTLLYIIRCWGNYPDAIAFSVLLANFAAPFIDHYTQPRTYGHKKGGQ